MNADQLKTVRDAIDAFDRVVAMTYDPNDHDEPNPNYSAADVFEAVCNLHTHVYEAYRAITTIVPQPPVSNQVLKSLCEMLYIAEGSDPHDFDEDTQRIVAEAQAARDAAADPCPDCHAREVLCESCGGLGYVPKAQGQSQAVNALQAIANDCVRLLNDEIDLPYGDFARALLNAAAEAGVEPEIEENE